MDSAAQMRSAATEPQVPGPGLPRPAPKKVATVQAQRVLFWTSVGSEMFAGLVVIGIAALAVATAKGS